MIAAAVHDALAARVVALVSVVMFAWSFLLYVSAVRRERRIDEKLRSCTPLNASRVDEATRRLRP